MALSKALSVCVTAPQCCCKSSLQFSNLSDMGGELSSQLVRLTSETALAFDAFGSRSFESGFPRSRVAPRCSKLLFDRADATAQRSSSILNGSSSAVSGVCTNLCSPGSALKVCRLVC